MKHETQANRLAEMIQDRIHYPAYELALPLVEVRRSKLKKLEIDDVLLTGFDRLECILLEGSNVCARTAFGYAGKRSILEIVHLSDDSMEQRSDTKKYKTVKCSFGIVKSKVLEPKHIIDIAHIDLQQVTIFSEDQKIAEGLLVKVDAEIAIQIKKVIK